MNEYKVYLTKTWFLFTLFYLLIDLGRPQDTISFIKYLKLGALLLVALIYFSFTLRHLIDFRIKQLKYINLFILLTSFYIPFAYNKFWAFSTTQTMLMLLPFLFSLAACLCNIKRLRVFIFFSILLAAYQGQYAIFHGGHGTGSQFWDENDLSLYLNIWIPFCYFFFLSENKMHTKILLIVGLIICLAGVVVSFSRGGFVGLISMLFVVWLVSPRKILNLSIVTIILIIGLQFVSDEYKSEMGTVTDTQDNTANERIESWRAGWRMFLDNPLGVGGNNFQFQFPKYQGDSFHRSMYGRVAHSLWFTLIPELGIFGIILYFSLLFFNIKTILNMRKMAFVLPEVEKKFIHSLSYSLLACFAGYFASGTFLSVLYYTHYWTLTVVVGASAAIVNQRVSEIYSVEKEVTDKVDNANLSVT